MAETMKAVIKPAPQPGLEMTAWPIPQIGLHDVLVKVKATSICGTDLHIYKWDSWSQSRIHPPLVVGHEFCGEVVDRGNDVADIKIGDFISAESHVICNTCAYCRTGRGNICINTQLLGVDRDGCFAEYVSIPAQNAWLNPPEMPIEIAVLMENFGNAVHTVFATNVTARKILVTGCGPVGIMAIAVARACGARSIYATDIHPYRLNLAKRMGADMVINSREEDVISIVRELTEGEGVDVLLEMSGAPQAIDQGFTLLKFGGEAALLGVSPGPFTFDWNHHIVFKGAIVKGITGRKMWETWYQGRGLLRSRAVDLAPLVTHQFPLSQFDEAIATMASGESGKVVLYP